jgi:uncharacterized protein YerC
LLTKAEKERRVVELYEQEKTYREIAREVRISPGDISDIIKRHTGELLGTVKPQNALQKLETIDTRAFKLFEAGKAPVKVAIDLDLRSDDVTKLYTEYLKLKGLEELSLLYEERKDDLHDFHSAYKLMVNETLTPRQLIDAANYLQELPVLERRLDVIKTEMEGLEYQRQEVYNNIVTANMDLNSIKLGIDVQKKEFERLNHQKLQVQTALVNMNTTAGYQQVQRIAEAGAGNILKQNQAVLGAALRAVFQALKEEPRNELQILIYGTLTYPMYESRYGNMPRNYLQLRQAVILQAAEEMYNNLLAKVVGNTMSSTLAI